MDLKMENTYWLRKDQGLYKGCDYFYPMALIFFTITSLKSKKIRNSRHFIIIIIIIIIMLLDVLARFRPLKNNK